MLTKQEYFLVQGTLFVHFFHQYKQILIYNFYLEAFFFSFGRSVGICLPSFLISQLLLISLRAYYLCWKLLLAQVHFYWCL